MKLRHIDFSVDQSSTVAGLNKKSKTPWESETKVKVKHAWRLYNGYVIAPN